MSNRLWVLAVNKIMMGGVLVDGGKGTSNKRPWSMEGGKQLRAIMDGYFVEIDLLIINVTQQTNAIIQSITQLYSP